VSEETLFFFKTFPREERREEKNEKKKLSIEYEKKNYRRGKKGPRDAPILSLSLTPH